jgi:putative ABC transport system substrate-binding protein
MRLGLCAAAFVVAFHRLGSSPPVPVRVTILMSQESPAYRAAAEGFRAGLAGRGVSVEIDLRAPGVPSDALVRQIRANPPDLILALGAPAAVVADSAFGTVPVVAVMLKRSEFSRLDHSTGVYLEFPVELELHWLKVVLPKARRVGVVYNPTENAALVAHATTVATGLGLELVPRKVGSRDRLPDALTSLANDVEVLWGLPDTLVLTPETARSFLLFQFRQRIPFAGLSDAWVRAGALYAIDRDWSDLGRQCADLAEQVLRGKTPRSLDPVAPRKIVLSLNQNTAQTLRLQVPADALLLARESPK